MLEGTQSKRELRDYQLKAFAYANRMDHPALFMQMRLGKSLIAIRKIKTYTPRDGNRIKVLIVAPSETFLGWKTELQEEGENSITELLGTKQERLMKLAFNMKWNLLNKEGHRALPEVNNVKWDAVILDESTFIKNPKSKVSNFYCNYFRKVPHRWILTGTPNPEDELDFFQQFKFLDGNAFGYKNFWNFRVRHFAPGYNGYSWLPNVGVKSFIYREVERRAFVLKRDQVKMDSPKIKEVRSFKLPSDLQKTYDLAEEEFIFEYNGKILKETKSAVANFTFLQELAGGYINNKLVWPDKINSLVELLKGELKREPLVIWFYFNDELTEVSKLLSKEKISHGIIKGSEPLSRRLNNVERFQKGKLKTLLFQVRCAKYGLDLSRASTAIYYSRPLGYEPREQSEDRILKVGNKRPLLYIDFVTENTVDEDIWKMLKTKASKSMNMYSLCQRIRERRDGK